jgi:uncharacterized membrane protein
LAEAPERRTLILVVDEDDDIGRKTGWKTPILGRDKNFLAAKDLLLSDPEEADANAMFAAVKLYDDLAKSGTEQLELATVAGKPGGGLDSDRKLAREIDEVLSGFPADQCIVITDGPLTDSVNAIITSRVKVVSVRKLVVKQNPSIETTWILLGKYLRTALFEFEYSRVILGIPGALAIVIGLLLQYNLLSPATLLVLFGIVLAVRGFGIDTAVISFFRRLQTIPYRPALTQLRIYIGFSSALLIVAALFAGINGVNAYVAANLPDAPPFHAGSGLLVPADRAAGRVLPAQLHRLSDNSRLDLGRLRPLLPALPQERQGRPLGTGHSPDRLPLGALQGPRLLPAQERGDLLDADGPDSGDGRRVARNHLRPPHDRWPAGPPLQVEG